MALSKSLHLACPLFCLTITPAYADSFLALSVPSLTGSKSTMGVGTEIDERKAHA